MVHDKKSSGEFLAIHIATEDGLFVASRAVGSRNPQEVADCLAKECGGYPERILLVVNGEHPDPGCYDLVHPEVVEDWNEGEDYSDGTDSE